jgi:hypothetical protein
MRERFDRFLALLEQTRSSHAVTSLISPKDRSEFEYGRVSGFFQGLAVAEELVNQVISEERQNELKRF